MRLCHDALPTSDPFGAATSTVLGPADLSIDPKRTYETGRMVDSLIGEQNGIISIGDTFVESYPDHQIHPHPYAASLSSRHLFCNGNPICLTTSSRLRCCAPQSVPSCWTCMWNQQAMLSEFQPRGHLHSATIHIHYHSLISASMMPFLPFCPNTWLHLRIHAVSWDTDRTHAFYFSSHMLYSYIIPIADRTPPPASSPYCRPANQKL